jgi:hypothetical protein
MDAYSGDLLVTDPKSGRTTGLAKTVRRVLRAMNSSGLPFSVIGASALAVRGLPRMTRDLDLTVLIDDGSDALETLRAAGLRAETPVGTGSDLEPMVVFVDPSTGVEVDLLLAAGDPEATVIDASRPAELFGVEAPVASLEQLLLLYLYSNQPKHLGDFAAIVQSGLADVAKANRALAIMHPEMLADFRARVEQARNPPKPPKRPKSRPRR